MAVSYKFDAGRLSKEFQDVADKVAEEVATRAVRYLKQGFEEHGFGSESWDKYSGITIPLRKSKGLGEKTSKMLYETGAMYESIQKEKLGDGLWRFGIYDNKAAIHEFGHSYAVTPRMRKFLAMHGVTLSGATNEIIIPPRPIMRPVIDRLRRELPEIIAEKKFTL